MKHVKHISVQRAQDFSQDPFNQPITFWLWAWSIWFVIKEWADF